MNKADRKNMVFFGLGTVGRDMFYSMESMYLIYFLSNVLKLSVATYATVAALLTVLRIFDAFNDPITGMIVDNTSTRWGKFKPPMLIGALLSAAFMVLMFSDLGLSGAWFIVFFGLCYLLWDVTYGANDIAYWSMMPTLTFEQKNREKIGSFARICANIGMYIVVVAIEPVTSALGNDQSAWFSVAVVVAVLMILFQLFTLFGVKEKKGVFVKEEKTTLKDMVRAIKGNDQLLWTSIAMGLFMIGYCTTTGFALYYMQYIYGDKGMYAVFAAILGVTQLIALVLFPLFSKRFTRKQLYFGATVSVVIGYIVFFFAPAGLMIPLAVAGVFMFVGQAFIQLLMLMFLADTIEYGQWKLRKRNDSVTFSIQPFINKIGGAISTGIISATTIICGIKAAADVSDSTPIDSEGKLILKIAMLVIPLLFIIIGYIIYRAKFKIDKAMFERIVADLKERGQLGEGETEK